MTISDKNKRMIITISKEDYARLEIIAKSECRSVSKQALLFLLKGIKDYGKEKWGE